MEVLQIHPKDTYAIRHAVLRHGKPIETCMFEGDDDELSFHLGAFVEKKLCSVASFYFRNHPNIDEPYQYQLRGMATLPEYQGQGFSMALLNTGFPMILKNNVKVVWCNARKSAVGFYEKAGFEIVGQEFEIKDIGPHFLMKKVLE